MALTIGILVGAVLGAATALVAQKVSWRWSLLLGAAFVACVAVADLKADVEVTVTGACLVAFAVTKIVSDRLLQPSQT